jgi:hypothetical protein
MTDPRAFLSFLRLTPIKISIKNKPAIPEGIPEFCQRFPEDIAAIENKGLIFYASQT